MAQKLIGYIKGEKGNTPKAGVDYYTPAERQALIDAIVGQLSGNGRTSKIGYVTLLAAAWAGEDNLYSQAVSIDGVTENSQVDLTPSIEQLAAFYYKDLTLVTENIGGAVTVYAIGQKPTNDYTIQVKITEVSV